MALEARLRVDPDDVSTSDDVGWCVPGISRARGGSDAKTYRRRDPAQGPLHRALNGHLEAYLAERAADPTRHLPGFVTEAMRAYLRCGILRHGFAQFRCEACPHSRLVALSCKERAFCPRCGGRRMTALAMHLRENVFPDVPVRQWVLTLPYELRWRMAFDHELTKAVWRIARGVIDAFYRGRATARRRPDAALTRTEVSPAHIVAIQRFGGALNLNVHFHAVYVDGAFTRQSDGGVRFVAARAPSADELEAIVGRIHVAVRDHLAKLGADDPDADRERLEQLALPGMASLLSEGVRNAGAWKRGQRESEPHGQCRSSKKARRKARVAGFDLDAHVTVGACRPEVLERLFRYILRPAIKEARLELVAPASTSPRIPPGAEAFLAGRDDPTSNSP